MSIRGQSSRTDPELLYTGYLRRSEFRAEVVVEVLDELERRFPEARDQSTRTELSRVLDDSRWLLSANAVFHALHAFGASEHLALAAAKAVRLLELETHRAEMQEGLGFGALSALIAAIFPSPGSVREGARVGWRAVSGLRMNAPEIDEFEPGAFEEMRPRYEEL